MPIQIIIFLTKYKLFASEINNEGKADAISIKGNPDIKCDDVTDVDELLECLFDAFSIDSFADENFDIVIVDCGGDKKIISYLNAKCSDAAKLSIISIEKLLPLLVWNKKQLASGEEVVVAFADACYKVACDEKKVVRFTGKARKGKENITLELDDFGCLYYFNVDNIQGSVVDTSALQEKDNVIAKLEEENNKLVSALNEKENALSAALATAKDAEKKITELNAEKVQWEKDHPKPSNLAEQMVKIVEECKKSAKDLGGDLYIKGNIPKNRLDVAIGLFSKKFKDVEIDRNRIIALFFNDYYDKNIDPSYVCKCVLITEEFLFFDRNSQGKKTLIRWNSLRNAEADDYWIDFTLLSVKRYSTEIVAAFNEEVITSFWVPLINKLKIAVDKSDIE